MAQLFTNNATSVLAQPISAAATTITLQSTTGARFPSVSVASGDFFLLTIFNIVNGAETDIEIVKVIDRTGDTLSVQRAQEGTTARAYVSGARVALRITADSINTIDSVEVRADTIISDGPITAAGVVSAGTGFDTTADSFFGEATFDGTITANQLVTANMGLATTQITTSAVSTLHSIIVQNTASFNGAATFNSAFVLTGDQVQISEGGTGATTAAAARTNLDVYSKQEADDRYINNTDSTLVLTNSLSVTGVAGVSTTALTASGAFVLSGDQVQISEGGTGATTATAARTNLGTVSDPAANGIAVRTAANVLTARNLTSGAGIQVTNSDGVAGNPSIANTGVLSLTSNTGLSTNTSATGNVTVTNVDRGSAQNIFKNIANNAGTTQFSAATNTDTLRFGATGTSTVSFDTTNKQVTISSADQFTGTVTSVAATGTNGISVTGSPITSSGTLTITSNATSANTASTLVSRDASGNFSAGSITASLVGSSTLLNGQSGAFYQNASNLNAGTLPDARFPATLPAVSGANLTNLNASNLATGTVANARTTGTSANTANTLVLRDASGNFSAGTITANLTGTATTATNQSGGTVSATSITGNTISVSGSSSLAGRSVSDAVGANTIVTRDGSGYSNFNYIHSNTANSENPGISQVITTNGSDGYYRKASIGHLTASLSGTAPISITGGIESTQPSLGYSVSGQNIEFASQGGPQVRGQGGGAAMMSFHRPGAYAINFGLGTDNQLRTGGWSRGGNHVILDAGNFNSYAPTLTGGGASGTWAINITGNAETVDGFSASQSTLGNTIVVRDPNGYIFGNYINMTDDGNPGGGASITSFITKQGDNYYRSVSPTNAANTLRGVASGTWGINVTGSAGSATTATNVSGGSVSCTTITYSGEVGTSSSSALRVPIGTSAQRAAANIGKMRYNTDFSIYEKVVFMDVGGAVVNRYLHSPASNIVISEQDLQGSPTAGVINPIFSIASTGGDATNGFSLENGAYYEVNMMYTLQKTDGTGNHALRFTYEAGNCIVHSLHSWGCFTSASNSSTLTAPDFYQVIVDPAPTTFTVASASTALNARVQVRGIIRASTLSNSPVFVPGYTVSANTGGTGYRVLAGAYLKLTKLGKRVSNGINSLLIK